MSTGWEVATDNAGPVTNGWITSNPTSPTSHGFTAPPSTDRSSPPPPAASPKPHIVSAQADKNAIPDSDWANWGTNPATIRSEDEQVVRPVAEYVQLPMKSNLSAGTTRPSQPRPGPATSAPHPGPSSNARPPANGHRNTQPHNYMPPRKQPMQPRMHAERPTVTYTSRPMYNPPPAVTKNQLLASTSTVQTPNPSRPPPLVQPGSPSEKSFKYRHAGSGKAASDADSGHAASPKLPSAAASASDKSKLPSTIISMQPKQATGWVVKVPCSPQAAIQPAAMPAATSAVDGQNGFVSSPEMPSTIVSVKAEDAEVIARLPRAPDHVLQAQPAGPSASPEASIPRTFSINVPDDIALRQLRDLKRYVATLSSEQVQLHVKEPEDDSEDQYSIHWEMLEDSHPVRLDCVRVTQKLLAWVREHCNQPQFGTEDPQLRQILSWALPSTSDHIVPSQVKVGQPNIQDQAYPRAIASTTAEHAQTIRQSSGQGPDGHNRSSQNPGAGVSTSVEEGQGMNFPAVVTWHPWVSPLYAGRWPNARYEMKIRLPPDQTSGLGGVRDWNFEQIKRWLSLESFYQHRKNALFMIEGHKVQTILNGRIFLVTLLHLRNPHFSSTDPRLQWDESEQAQSAQLILYEQRDTLKDLDISEATQRLLQQLHPREVAVNGQNGAEAASQKLLSLPNTNSTEWMASQPIRASRSIEPMGTGPCRYPDEVAAAPARLSTAAPVVAPSQLDESLHRPAPASSLPLSNGASPVKSPQTLLYHPWVLPYKGHRHNGFYELRVQVSSEMAVGLAGYRDENYVQVQRRLGLHSFFHHRRVPLFFIEGDRVQAILDGLKLLIALLHLRDPQFRSAEPKLWFDDSNKALMLARQLLADKSNSWRNKSLTEVTGWLLNQLISGVEEPTPAALPFNTAKSSNTSDGDDGALPTPNGQSAKGFPISEEPRPESTPKTNGCEIHNHGVASTTTQHPFTSKETVECSPTFNTSTSPLPLEEAVEADIITWHVPDLGRRRFLGNKWSHIHAIEAECGVRIDLVPSLGPNAEDLRFIKFEALDLSAPKASRRLALCQAVRLCKGLMIISGTSSCLPFKADLPSWVPAEIRSLPPSDIAAALSLHQKWNRKEAKMDISGALVELLGIYRTAAPSQATPLVLPAFSSTTFGAAYELSTPLNSYTWTGRGSEDAGKFRRLCYAIADICGMAAMLVDLTEARHGANQCGILILASVHATLTPQQRARLEDAYIVTLASLIATGGDGLFPVAEDFEQTGNIPKVRLTPAQVRVAQDFGHWRDGEYVSKEEVRNFVAQLKACDKPVATANNALSGQEPPSIPCGAYSTPPAEALNVDMPSFILQGSPHVFGSTSSSDMQCRELSADEELPYTFDTLLSYRRSLSPVDWLAEIHSGIDDGYICQAQEAAMDHAEDHSWSSLSPLQRMAYIGSATWAAWHVKSVWMACKASLSAPAHRPSSEAASLSGTVGPSASQIERPGSTTSSEYHSMKGDKAEGVTSWEEAEAQVVLEQSRAPRVSDWVQRVELRSPEQLSELEENGTISLTSEEFFGAHSISQPYLSSPGCGEAEDSVIEVPLPLSHVVRGRIIGEKQDTLLSISRRTGANVRLAPHVYGENPHGRPIWVSGPDKAVSIALQELHQLIKGQVPHFQFTGALGDIMRELSVQTKSAQLEQVTEQDRTDPQRWTPELLFFIPAEALAKVTANISRGKWNTGGATVTLERLGQIRVVAPSLGHVDSVCIMVVDCVRTIIPGWIPSDAPAAKVIRDADEKCGFKVPQSAPATQCHEAEIYIDSYGAITPPDPHKSGWRTVVKPPGKLRGYVGSGYLEMPEPIFTSRAGMSAGTHGNGGSIYSEI